MNIVLNLIFILLYISYIILTIKLSTKNRNMSPALLAYGIIISLIYIVCTCIVEKDFIYVNIIYLIAIVVLLLLNVLNTKKRAESSYVLDLLTMLLIMLLFTGEIVCILTIIGTLISIALYIIICKIKQSKSVKNKTMLSSNINVVFIMGILNLFIFLALTICSRIN